MEKVKVTQEQANAIEMYSRGEYGEEPARALAHHVNNTFNNSVCLQELTLDELATCFYVPNSYEIEPEYKVGNWVVYDNGPQNRNKVNKITHMNGNVAEFDKGRMMDTDKLRHATPEEIATEKERRFFAENDRDVWELKEKDLLWDDKQTIREVINVRKSGSEIEIQLITYGHSQNHISVIDLRRIRGRKYKVVCFAKDRKDIKHEGGIK